MPEARDRLSRQDDVVDVFRNGRQRSSVDNGGLEILIVEDATEANATATPFRWRGASMVGTPTPMRVSRRRGALGSPGIRHTPNFGRSSPLFRGRENMSPVLGSGRGRGGIRGRGSVILPAWYPRKPLRDITAVVRAIERRRARRGEGEGLETESPTVMDQIVHDSSISTSVAQLEQDHSATTPLPTIGVRRCPPSIGKVPKILLNITNQINEDSSCLTPQKKLLNNIDKVEREVMEELQKLRRTPSAKRAEREKKVRTLMSMR